VKKIQQNFFVELSRDDAFLANLLHDLGCADDFSIAPDGELFSLVGQRHFRERQGG